MRWENDLQTPTETEWRALADLLGLPYEMKGGNTTVGCWHARSQALRRGFAYNVRNCEGGDNYWIRIGSAWAHADGNGFNIQLETVPLDGRIVLRVASEKK